MYKLKKKNFSVYLDQLKERLFREREFFQEIKNLYLQLRNRKRKKYAGKRQKKQLGTAVIEKKEVRIEKTGKLIFEERNRGLNICINAQLLKIY